MGEDKHLILKARTGDRDALRQIYVKYKDTLFTIAMSLLKESNAAEDVMHDVFVSFTRNIANFHLYGSLKSFLITCVLNRSRDMLKSKMYRVVEIKRTISESSDNPGPLQQSMSHEQMGLVEDAMAKIPEQQREVIVLRLHGDLKFKEIANVQKVSVGTVQGRYHYGLEKLKTILDGQVS